MLSFLLNEEVKYLWLIKEYFLICNVNWYIFFVNSINYDDLIRFLRNYIVCLYVYRGLLRFLEMVK